MFRRPAPAPLDPEDEVSATIPFGVRLAGAWSWRMLAVVAVIAVVIYLVALLHIVVIPLAVATLLAGLLTPLKNRMIRRGIPRGLAVVAVFVGLIVALAGLVVLVVLTLRSGISDFETHAEATYKNLLATLKASPLGISDTDVQNAIDSVTKALQTNSDAIASGALTGASTAGDIVVGFILSLFITLFFLIDGAGIWRWCVRIAPRNARAAVDGAGKAAWLSVGEYVRVQVLVALIDAVGVGLIAAILHVPFFVPIAVIVFLGAFIPFVGAIIGGGLAVVAALVYNDPLNALIMLGGVILVNQLESHVLQPLLLGGAVRLHPVGVVLAVSIGTLVGGVAGAVFAVPFTAAVNSIVHYIAGGRWKHQPPPTEPSRTGKNGADPRPQDVTTVA